MTSLQLSDFKEVWFHDFEFSAPQGENPEVVCLVAKELYSGQVIRLFQEDLTSMEVPPFNTKEDALVVAYYASAEMNCFNQLGWDYPAYLLDLYTEFRNHTNGKKLLCGSGLLGALTYFKLDSIEASEKDELRQLAMRGGPYTDNEEVALLDYCQSDVVALEKLYNAMVPILDAPRAIYRGEYMKTVAEMETNGIPIDFSTLTKMTENWESIRLSLIEETNKEFNVFEGTSFRTKNFERYLIENDLSWPRLPTGSLALDDTTFRDMSQTYPQLVPLHQTRETLSKLRLNKLAVSPKDHRNRTLLSPFRSITGRNQPSNSKFIFGASAAMRSLIKPKQDYSIAYIDWSQQEFGIAAKLSNDKRMLSAYTSGDPYLAFAKQAGAVPEEATKASHADERKLFKACVLAVQYCMGYESLARRTNTSVAEARELLNIHKRTYKDFWSWSDKAIDYAMLTGEIQTTFGWTMHIGPNTNPRTIRNFPMQANGAEMLRIALNMLREKGIKICAPIHDAILIESNDEKFEEDIQSTLQVMEDASAIVLNGFELKADVDIVSFPGCFKDERGEAVWNKITNLLQKVTSGVTEHNNRSI